jgi:hypothetical protein
MSSLKYRPAIVETFLDHYATGLYTIAELCKLVNIHPNTFYHWQANEEDFKKALAVADKRKISNIHSIAVKGAVKLLTGVEYDEISEEYEMPPARPKYDFLDDDDELNQLIKPEDPKPVLKRRFITKKIILPHANTVMFTLRNLDKENFPDNKDFKPGNTQPIPVAFIAPPGMVISFPSNTDDPNVTDAINNNTTNADGNNSTGTTDTGGSTT